MTRDLKRTRLTRRQLLRGGVGMAVGAGLGRALSPLGLAQAAPGAQAVPAPKYHLAGTDGWISLPPSVNASPYHPDSLAPSPYSTYMFGFADVTGLDDAAVRANKMKAQHCAPLLYFEQNQEVTVRLSNLGLQMRPDLIDAHTIHWHGLRHALPIFDGEPTSSVSVPIGRSLSYYYRPRVPGTYMYHCHVEDTEHVHMGMTGVIVVTPEQNNGAVPGVPAGKYAFADELPPAHPASTAYDREFVFLLSEVWLEAHWDDAHIQLPEWSDYVADYVLLNGRTYPDTLLPGHSPRTDSSALRFQPYSSLVTANAGERILLRFVNLGFTFQTMSLGGLRMRVVGKDATLLRGRGGADTSYVTSSISLGPGESADAIVVAPGVSQMQTYLLGNRNYARSASNGDPGLGGPLTEVRIYPAGTLPPQIAPNS